MPSPSPTSLTLTLLRDLPQIVYVIRQSLYVIRMTYSTAIAASESACRPRRRIPA